MGTPVEPRNFTGPSCKIAVTMEVYAEVVSASTKDALRRLGEQLDSGDAV